MANRSTAEAWGKQGRDCSPRRYGVPCKLMPESAAMQTRGVLTNRRARLSAAGPRPAACRLPLAGAAALALAALCGCAVNPVSGKSDLVFMSETEELALGRQYHGEIMRQYREYADPALRSHVAALGAALAGNSHRPGLQFRFTLLDSPEVNAFALPGGYIYITRGIMAYMNSEAHLAGVLGHEIGHVTARHGVRQHSSSKIAEFVGKALLRKTDDQAAALLSNLLGGAILRGYGRKHELEADRLGAEYLARSGYEPRDMIGVVGILKDQEEFEKQRAREERRQPRIYHGVFSTHPDNDRRLQEVIAAADRFRGAAAAARDDAAFIRRLDGMAFGERQSGRRLRVVQVRPGERIADLARVSALERHAEAQLRLLNGLYPDGEPRPGQWIKIVQ